MPNEGDPNVGPWQEGPWLIFTEGLASGVFDSPQESVVSDSKVYVLRVDPQFFTFTLVAAGEVSNGRTYTVPEWVERHGLTGGINASMYLQDYETSVFYMRNGSYVNNSTWHSNAGSIFATGRRVTDVSEVQIIDRTCQDLTDLDPKYDTLVQNYRMMDCDKSGTWSESAKIFSIACVGQDGAGRILFIHSRSPYSVHDFTEILLGLPLDLTRLMYVEGGPEASLYATFNGTEIVSRVGSYETDFTEHDNNIRFWDVPNIIGFSPKPF